MSITPRGKGYWLDVGKGSSKRFRMQINCTSLGPAQWAHSRIEKLQEEGKEINKEEIKREALDSFGEEGSQKKAKTLQELMDATYRHIWQHKKSADTAYLNARLVVELLGPNLPINHINRDRVEEMNVRLRARGNSDATLNRKRSALSTMLDYAVGKEWLIKKPSLPPINKETEHRIRFLSDEEEAELLNLCDLLNKPDMKDLFIVMIYTGARCSEAVNLKGFDVDAHYVHFRNTKNNKDRSVRLCSKAAEVLHRRKQEYKGKLFPLTTKETVRWTWNRVKGFMGLDDDEQFVPHILRHTFASRLVQRGVALKVIQELLGHTTINTTMRYAHLARGHLDAAVAVLDDAGGDLKTNQYQTIGQQ